MPSAELLLKFVAFFVEFYYYFWQINMFSVVLRPSSTLNLIYENVKYSTTVTKTSAQSYAFVLNNSFLEVNLQPLVAGGSLIRFGTESHLTYVTEEVCAVSS